MTGASNQSQATRVWRARGYERDVTVLRRQETRTAVTRQLGAEPGGAPGPVARVDERRDGRVTIAGWYD